MLDNSLTCIFCRRADAGAALPLGPCRHCTDDGAGALGQLTAVIHLTDPVAMQKVPTDGHSHELRSALASLLQSGRVRKGASIEVDVLSSEKGLVYAGSLLLSAIPPHIDSRYHSQSGSYDGWNLDIDMAEQSDRESPPRPEL